MIVDAAEILQEEAERTESEAGISESKPYEDDIVLHADKRRDNWYRRNTCVVNLAVSMLVGAAVGALISDGSMTPFFLAPYIKQSSADFASVFASSVLDLLMYIGPVFLLGFSAVSLPLTAAVPFIKGLGIGVNIALLVSSGTEGILVPLLQAVPYIVLSGICVILAVKECIGFSYMLFGLVTKGGRQVYFVNPIGAKYAAIFLNIALVGLVAAAVNGLIFLIGT